MNWGKSIILAFVVFTSFVGVLAYKMATAKVDLVRPNYYQTELDYQKQIDRIKNSTAHAAAQIIHFSKESNRLTIDFPHLIEEGEVNFYRSSDKNMDVKVQIQSTQLFYYSTAKLKSGKWKVQATWAFKGLEYFVEEEIIIK